MFCLFYRLLCK